MDSSAPEAEDREDPEPWEASPIHRAALFGDVAAMERLIAAGADINARTGRIDDWLGGDLTPLMLAALSVDGATAETLAWMLDHGADLRAVSSKGVTAAWYAAGENGRWKLGVLVQRRRQKRGDTDDAVLDHAERLRFLLDAGLDPQESMGNGRSLIVEACNAGDPARVRLLLERGASPHYTGKRRKSSFQIPLFCAVEADSADCVRLLLDAGADAQETTRPMYGSPGETALTYAASPEVARLLLDAGARVDARDWREDVLGRVLNRAARATVDAEEDEPKNLLAVADVLLEAGASLDGVRDNGWTRLYTAALFQRESVFAWLLARGASLASCDRGSTPLHAVCWSGGGDELPACERIIRTLVAEGVPIEARDLPKRTPLHVAVGGDNGNHAAVRTLLELGADPNPVDALGQTPLHRAAEWGELACLQTLLANGADPLRSDAQGVTPLDLAAERERSEREAMAENSAIRGMEETEAERQARHLKEFQFAAAAHAALVAAAARSSADSGRGF